MRSDIGKEIEEQIIILRIRQRARASRSHCPRHRKRGSQTIWIADAPGYGKRFVVRADEMLTAFVELQRALHEFAVSLIL